MSDAETAARGQRAALCNEFIRPVLEECLKGYRDRIVEIAGTELNAKVRMDKITALSFAIYVLNNLTNGLNAAIEAGKVAERSILRADEIEGLSDHSRRLLEMTPLR